jgi:hypothetical protein
MEKPDANKSKKPNKKVQYERFQEAAHGLGIDNEKSAESFERAFEKIVPAKHKPTEGR